MKRKIYGTLFLAIVGIGIVGCKKGAFKPKHSSSIAKVEDEKQTKIGKKLRNPFTIENMRNAYAILSKQKSSSTLESNKLYVRFLPLNSNELNELYSDSLILSDIPLDVEVNQYGTFYNDPATLSNGTTWLYTTVDLGYDFGNLQHEVIDSLFLPNEGGDGQKSMNLFADFSKDDLEIKALELAGYKDEISSSLEKATQYRPKGYIRVQQSINGINTLVPVKQLKIRTRWWFDYGTGFTNDNGYFECNETYRRNRNVDIVCIFENSSVDIRAIKGTQFWDMFFTERKNIGEYENSALESLNYTFANSSDVNSDTKRKWMCCHAINSVREQQIFCLQNGITPPPSNLNLWLTNANTNGNSLSSSAAAPMLKQMSNSSFLVNGAQLWLIGSGNLLFSIAIQVLEQFPPDITYNYSQSPSFYTNSDYISNIFYHELAHASHYRKVGNTYWTSYIAYIVQHGGYGESTTSGSGRIAISEAWAEFCGARFAHLRYGNVINSAPNSSSWLEYIERFRPYPNPSNPSYWKWIPDGIMHDLTDVGEPNWFTYVKDNVSGFSISQCFGAMDSDITTVAGYKTRFINENGTSQQATIDDLFISYGY